MAISDDFGNISELLLNIIKDNIDETAFKWIIKAGSADEIGNLGQAFVMLPRKTGKSLLHLSELQKKAIEQADIIYITDWSIDRLARVWLLSVQSFADAQKSHPVIEQLFLSAEMNEAVALYSALPFLAEPESWVKRCSEGIRSNIGSVLEAIMENNPYPSKYLNEAAWNQLVLKAFFTEKDINKIYGLDERVNEQLALTLSDYARERYAAGRQINPQLWRLAGPFLNEEIFEAIKIGLNNQDEIEHKAIALAIFASDYEPAKVYINQFPELCQVNK
ncbi:EboA domain-containing protein [Pedobacter aquatilis]|uniref:EboA domain-containing protein n=1 Tax=Pedobacter aquatilis TaxID=351343 RepID=UPI0025B55CF7|nr:EboA domain-containing protein [Pedobacter aquatilis]MDN3585957.1 EboA domain-containing protein [Pedobacter aquatilis]